MKESEVLAVDSGSPREFVRPASPDLIDILCFRCVGRGRKGLVARIEKYDHHLVIQNAVKVRRPLAMLIIKCHRCSQSVEYPLGLLDDQGGLP